MGAGRPIKDRTGLRYGKLVVLKLHEVKDNRAYWLCRCDCGNLKTIAGKNLSETKSCGCSHSEASRKVWQERRERAWQAMRKEEDSIRRDIRREDYACRQMIRNQEAGESFDDFWMFGHDGEKWWKRITTGSP